uniref:Uncharacterized protein n=1 Tax=Moniliophthora roreri TaxID=221103 RepID=A0A0W0G192_MONRR
MSCSVVQRRFAFKTTSQIEIANTGINNVLNLEKTHFYSFYTISELEHFNMTQDDR